MASPGAVSTNVHGSTLNSVGGNQTYNNTVTYFSTPGMVACPSMLLCPSLRTSAGPPVSLAIPGSSALASNNDSESSKRDSVVYARILLVKGHGYPLWIPEPFSNLPRAYRSKGVRIGDLGIITTDGGFDFLFNICLPPDHPINMGRVPPGFSALPLDRCRDITTVPDMHGRGCDIASTSVRMENVQTGGGFNDEG